MSKIHLHLTDGSKIMVNKSLDMFTSEFLDSDGDFHVGAIHLSENQNDSGGKIIIVSHNIVSIHEAD